ncbi:MAG: NarL family transcriptional regulator [Candidatus Taylorbacteria bacterium RIFCSPHIGHO2_01_FULL_46_22b]|uniref:NarL family transcriptional regulator n=1 Tax=Candidatus Taylorbacteria bacterium RIFCSPHIGHO2_01_FULL_46_22b TaxID=1802301 RepID=A0A1G2M615_9BACT|nr:MAG: NarL family transcriptional regulator [Candidatus Taylorbacteria bacterium RIFCSPHIGHO2_01_FULL_46_22b]
MRVPYALTVYGKEEIRAVNEVLKDPTKLVTGPRVREFEQKIAALFGKKFGIMVNSGSSANVLAVESMELPVGSEVITPVLTFATTVAPIVQKNLVPAFADVEEGTYQINTNQLEELLSPKTKAIMIPSLIGNLPDFSALESFAKKHDLWFVEDSCDTLGARFNKKPTGAYSDISTTSFYASHVITAAAAGGVVAYHDPVLAKRALIKANWGRESTLFGFYEKSEEIQKRFTGMLGDIPYDAKFIFSEIGYNFQVTEINGAFGLEQLKRYPEFARRRKQNFKKLLKFFKQYEHLFVLPVEHPDADTAWLAFPLTIRKGAPFTRLELTKHLEEQNIQTRPIFTGNILRQPAFANITAKKLSGGYPVAENIMRNGFLIGCHHGLTDIHLEYLFDTFADYLKRAV